MASDDLERKVLGMVPSSVLATIHAGLLASFTSGIVVFRVNAIKPGMSTFSL